MDDLEEMLRASAPPVDVQASGVAARDVASAVAKEYRRRPRRLTRRVVVGTVGALLIPAVAAAGVLHFSAETGQYGKPGFTENDTSQYITSVIGSVNQVD